MAADLPFEGCERRGGVCDCAGRPCAVDWYDWLAGSLGARSLPDGRVGVVWPLTFGRARLVVSAPLAPAYDDAW